MAYTYGRVNQESTGTPPSSGSGNPFSQTFTTGDWVGPSGGYYTITILETTHDKGTSAGVQVFQLNGSAYEQIEVDLITINGSGDVEIRVLSTPDLRLNGKIVILD